MQEMVKKKKKTLNTPLQSWTVSCKVVSIVSVGGGFFYFRIGFLVSSPRIDRRESQMKYKNNTLALLLLPDYSTPFMNSKNSVELRGEGWVSKTRCFFFKSM